MRLFATLLFSLGFVTPTYGANNCLTCPRPGAAPPAGQCQSYDCGGPTLGGVHFYTCCNYAGTACDGEEYDGASGGNYCGAGGANLGDGNPGCSKGPAFNCRGCAGTTACKTWCDANAPNIPGLCWRWQDCFEMCCADPDGPVGGVNGWKKIKFCLKNGFQPDRRELSGGDESCAPCEEHYVPESRDCHNEYCGDGVCSDDECCSTCPEDCPPPDDSASCGGDPHFRTTAGDVFSYHGECDLVMLDNPAFGGGKGIKLYVRTEIDHEGGWSGVSNAALMIGHDVLEVVSDATHYLNGVHELSTNGTEFRVDDYRVTKKKTINCFEPEGQDEEEGEEEVCHEGWTFLVHIAKGEFIRVSVHKLGLLFVKTVGKDLHSDATGLIGTSGEMISRDGERKLMTNHKAFAEEWQVQDDEPTLFHHPRFPQFPETCVPPPRRQLRENKHHRRLAEQVCSNVPDSYMEACLFDITMTGAPDISFHYLD